MDFEHTTQGDRIMIYIQHRVNSVQDLEKIQNLEFGCEIDLRSDVSKKGHIHLAHDPWSQGDDFFKWLDVFKKKQLRGPLILNTKEDGLEQTAMEALQKRGLTNFFFLDTTLPTLVKWTDKGIKNFAVRLSRYEPLESAKAFSGRADWLWVDCFQGQFIQPPNLKGFKICLVSPELQSSSLELDENGKNWLKVAHAICTKKPEFWQSLSSV